MIQTVGWACDQCHVSCGFLYHHRSTQLNASNIKSISLASWNTQFFHQYFSDPLWQIAAEDLTLTQTCCCCCYFVAGSRCLFLIIVSVHCWWLLFVDVSSNCCWFVDGCSFLLLIHAVCLLLVSGCSCFLLFLLFVPVHCFMLWFVAMFSCLLMCCRGLIML